MNRTIPYLSDMLSRIVARLGGSSTLNSEEQAYRRLASRGYSPSSIIDVGGYHGDWTRIARAVFPDVPVLIVEAQPSKTDRLKRLCKEIPGVTLESSVLASKSGRTVTFYEMETGSSLMPEQSDVPRRSISLVSRTLDEVAGALAAPIFLKIDVQGAEMEVLKGGLETLKRCDLVQLELAFLPYNKGAPEMLAMISFMDALGFTPFDVTNLTRPDRIHLVQADFLFCRRESALRPKFFNLVDASPAPKDAEPDSH